MIRIISLNFRKKRSRRRSERRKGSNRLLTFAECVISGSYSSESRTPIRDTQHDCHLVQPGSVTA